jgi:hypothetical protein
MRTDPHIRGRAKSGDIIRLYGYPGTFLAASTTSASYDLWAMPIRDGLARPGGFPALDASLVEINGQPVPCLSCPIAPPAEDYPHMPLFEYDDGPEENSREAINAWIAARKQADLATPVCTSFGADPDLKPGPMTQDDRGLDPNRD